MFKSEKSPSSSSEIWNFMRCDLHRDLKSLGPAIKKKKRKNVHADSSDVPLQRHLWVSGNAASAQFFFYIRKCITRT